MKPDDATTIPLSAVRPGARLRAAVLGADGKVLMTAGSLLSEAALEKLAARGVVAVAVDAERDEAEIEAARAALRRRLAYLFRKCDLEHAGTPAQLIHQAVLKLRLEGLP